MASFALLFFDIVTPDATEATIAAATRTAITLAATLGK